MEELHHNEENAYFESLPELRPHFLKNFIGQKRIKENLSTYIQSAKKRNQVLDHVLLSGPPGLGKTTLARIIANEMNSPNLIATTAPALEKTGDLAAILTSLEKGSILFIDEIHRLKSILEEVLYSAMEDFCIDIVIGQGPGAKSVKINLNPFTLIGATTRAGMLSGPFQTRFGIDLRIDFYDNEELEEILVSKAKILKIKISEESKKEIAKRSRGTPRIILKLLKRVWDFSIVAEKEEIDIDITQKALERMGIDDLGLSLEDRKILDIMIKHYNGGPVGLQTIAISLGDSEDTIEDIYEPFLIRQGFIKKTPRGRIVSPRAYEYLGYKKIEHSLF